MTTILTAVWLLCVVSVLHTYVFYPWWVLRRARSQVPSKDQEKVENWPPVTVLMAVHNEAVVIAEKLDSLAVQDYPGELRVLIGSDCSTDATEAIIKEHQLAVDLTVFRTRQGKPNIINQLAAKATGDIFVITDASVMLRPNTVRELVRPLATDPGLGVVDTTMVQTGAQADGIGLSEKHYIDREVAVKRAESTLFGHMIGPFGGCWAVRAAAYVPVPANFLVDDFFLCLAAYEQGYRGLSSERAIVEEAVGQSIRDEFRRKVRISSGNWQNLIRFRRLWWPCWKNGLAFAFFSHKVLRWWTPFFLLIGFISGVLLALLLGNHWFTAALCLSVLSVGLVLLVDYFLAPLNVHLLGFRNLRYFLAMNAALLVGCWRYLTGITSNVWQPSNRH
ncbi:MAG: glycosyltransferase [Bacteroidota bacterium]